MHIPSRWSPWRSLRSRASVRVAITGLPCGVWGATDGVRTIWLHDRLTQAERRSTLAHELAHHELGHGGCQPPAEEERARRWAAEQLLPVIEDVAEALAWAHSRAEAAEALWVDVDTLEARLQHMTPGERRVVEERMERGASWGT